VTPTVTPAGLPALAAGVTIELPGRARALFTDRSHGNLSSVGGAGHEDGLRARERLRARCGVRALLRAYQVHGTEVAAMGAEDPAPPPDSAEQPSVRADGYAVAAPGVAAMAMAADCLPIVLAAEGAVAAVHAGWRGLAAGVLEQGVRALRGVGGRGEIVAVLGPCAGACCYEVGEEVHAAFARDGGGGARDLVRAPGRLAAPPAGSPAATIDLRVIAHRRLRAAGVVEAGDFAACTICDERFFSYRREGAAAGRQAAVVWLT
jgi:YfiH family protein